MLHAKQESCRILSEKNDDLLKTIDVICLIFIFFTIFPLKKKEQEVLLQRKNYSLALSSKADELLQIENNLTNALKENLEKKKFLNNELQELKGNIRVYCRIRPFLSTRSLKRMIKL